MMYVYTSVFMALQFRNVNKHLVLKAVSHICLMGLFLAPEWLIKYTYSGF